MFFKRIEYVQMTRRYEYEFDQEELDKLNEYLVRRWKRVDGQPIEPIKMEDIPTILSAKDKLKEGQMLVDKNYPSSNWTSTTYEVVYDWINDSLWESYDDIEDEETQDVDDYFYDNGKEVQFNYRGILE